MREGIGADYAVIINEICNMESLPCKPAVVQLLELAAEREWDAGEMLRARIFITILPFNFASSSLYPAG